MLVANALCWFCRDVAHFDFSFHGLQVERCLSPEIFDSAKLERMIKTFEDEIKLANSTDGNLRKKTDLFWENTFVRRLLDGTG
jgi:hypothetical protein